MGFSVSTDLFFPISVTLFSFISYALYSSGIPPGRKPQELCHLSSNV